MKTSSQRNKTKKFLQLASFQNLSKTHSLESAPCPLLQEQIGNTGSQQLGRQKPQRKIWEQRKHHKIFKIPTHASNLVRSNLPFFLKFTWLKGSSTLWF